MRLRGAVIIEGTAFNGKGGRGSQAHNGDQFLKNGDDGRARAEDT